MTAVLSFFAFWAFAVFGFAVCFFFAVTTFFAAFGLLVLLVVAVLVTVKGTVRILSFPAVGEVVHVHTPLTNDQA